MTEHGQETHNTPGTEQLAREGDDDGKNRYEIAIPTRNLRWTNLARYLELEFKEFGVQVPKDQKTVTVLNEHFVVILPVRLNAEQKQDIDLLRGSQADVDEFLAGLEKDKLGDLE